MDGGPVMSKLETAPLALDGVITDLGGRRVLDGVDLALAPGRITVLVGPSGVGKTTCIRHLCGLLQPTDGRVLVAGRDMDEMSDDEIREVQRTLSLMQQGSSLFTAGLFGSLSIADNIAFPLRARSGKLKHHEIEARVGEWLDAIGLAPYAHHKPGQLSGGMVRRVALARALVSGSPTVILDDIESGLDGVRLALICELIRETQRETGATMLIATHDARSAFELADVLAVLRAGRIEQIGPPAELTIDADDESFAKGFLAGDTSLGLQMDDELDAHDGQTPPARPLRDAAERQFDIGPSLSSAFLMALVVLSALFFVAKPLT